MHRVEKQKPIIALVEKILAAKRQCSADNPVCESKNKTQTGLSVLHWEAEIDQLVYALYGLTEDEIKIVEGKE